MQLDFADVLLEVIDRRASDLHITAGAPPTVRVRGRLVPMDGFPVPTANDTREIVYSILSEGQRQRFENNWQLDSPTRSRGAAGSASTPTSSGRRSAPRSG
jgi:twitching motility protein PilT